MDVAVVGAGIAGAACGRELVAAGHQVRLVDRGRAAGGRLASRRLAGRPVDLGASYFTVSDDRFGAVVADWQARGLAREWTDTFHAATPAGLGEPKQGPMRYGAPLGLRALVTDLLAPLAVEQAHQVETVGPGATVDGQPYDAVVLAMPDPQALRLLDPSLEQARAALADRQWEPVLALAAGFGQRSWELDGCFVNDHPELSFVADDGARRGDGAPVLVAHSTPTFAARHLADPDAAGPQLVTALRALLHLPEPSWTYVQRWTYAKPVGSREEPFGRYGPVGLCGDGWGASKVQAAWLSGHLLGRELARQ